MSAGIDDRVYVYRAAGPAGVRRQNVPLPAYVADAPFILLGHNSNQTAPLPSYDGGLLKNAPANIASGGRLTTGAVVSGLALSGDGRLLGAANFENDSVSIVDTATRTVTREVPFTTVGQGAIARGEYPYGVAVLSDNAGRARKIFVSSQRDNEVISVRPQGSIHEIPVGSQPNNILLSKDGRTLFVANGNDDSVSVINTSTDSVVGKISLAQAGGGYKGANPNGLALDPSGGTLYVTLGGENAVAVVALGSGRVAGLIPTGWYPNSVSVSHDGRTLYVVNGKSNSGPDPANGYVPDPPPPNPTFKNEYDWANEKTSLSVIPVPDRSTLSYLTRQVDLNNGVFNRKSNAMMAFLHTKISHVIYIVDENRTYDQVLGDLSVGNGDPLLTTFPRAATPNHHATSEIFADLDNYYSVGESSGVGWDWSTQGYDTEFTEKSQAVLYGNSNFNGLTYDYQGTNRNINIAYPQTSGSPNQLDVRETGLLDPTGSSSILPGSHDVAEPENSGDLDAGAVGGYIWDEALRRGLTLRNYGQHVDEAYYDIEPSPLWLPISRTPFASGIPQAPPTKADLMPTTDIYYRGFDEEAPDTYRFEEWNREFQNYVAGGDLPNLEVITLPHDHFGNFGTAVEGLNTPILQMSDNDWGFGQLVEAVSHSPYWSSTAIFLIEDDSQSGPDHVDGHRSPIHVISPYVRHGSVVSTFYNTDNVLRTIEDLLGMNHLSDNDADSGPMADVFSRTPNMHAYDAIVPGDLCQPPVAPDLVPRCDSRTQVKSKPVRGLHGGAWWAQQTRGMNFRIPDAVDSRLFNRLLWRGIMGETAPYPEKRSGANLSKDRTKPAAATGKKT